MRFLLQCCIAIKQDLRIFVLFRARRHTQEPECLTGSMKQANVNSTIRAVGKAASERGNAWLSIELGRAPVARKCQQSR